MISHRALHPENGVVRSVLKPSIFVFPKHTIPIRTSRRPLSFLEATASTSRLNNSDFESVTTIQKALPNVFVAREEKSPIEVAIPEPEVDTMNAQKEAELLAMQHILGLKDASDEAIKIKPKELERLQHLKAAEPVFVCIDLEAFEFAQNKITEVGISVLDSRHLAGIDPSPNGNEWLSKINTRHILIKEHKHLVNKRFVHGCPDKFNFGSSEVVSLKHIHKTLTQIFNNPSSSSLLASDSGSRNLILVGHGLSNDTAYLSKLNFAPHAKGNIIRDVDTTKFVGTKKQTVGLSKLMVGLGVDPENLHNAGNDAAYTMQALLLMTIQHTNNPGAFVKAVADAKARVDPAKQRYKDHKAAVRAKKLAQEKDEAAKGVLPQILKLGQHAVESALPGTTHDRSLVAGESVDRTRAAESQWQNKANTGSEIDHVAVNSSSRKRKSSDVGPIVSENQVRLITKSELQNEQSVETMTIPPTTSDTGSSLRIIREATRDPRNFFAHARAQSSASSETAVYGNENEQQSFLPEAPSQPNNPFIKKAQHTDQQSFVPDVPSRTDIAKIRKVKVTDPQSIVPDAPSQNDTSFIRKVEIEKTEMPLDFDKGAIAAEASRPPAPSKIRTVATSQAKDVQQPARYRAIGHYLREGQAEQPGAPSEVPTVLRAKQ